MKTGPATPLNMRALKRIGARDRRLAAIHEAGHVTMARHISLPTLSARLIKQKVSSITLEKSWTGQTEYLSPEQLGLTVAREQIAMFAVAGSVAELCWLSERCDEVMFYWEDEEAMSATDWASTGCKAGEPTSELLDIIENAFALFDRQTGVLWPTLLKESRRLIEESRALTELAR